jgi:hypothetical protein
MRMSYGIVAEPLGSLSCCPGSPTHFPHHTHTHTHTHTHLSTLALQRMEPQLGHNVTSSCVCP